MISRKHACSIVVLASIAACKPAAPKRDPNAPTFSREIAPIIFERCAPCHRPNEAAPFPFLSYADVKEHAEQIAEVIKSGYMPPWLPARGIAKYAGERSLAPEELAMILRWIELGAPEGDRSELPPLPRFPEGWAIGTPDLVLEVSDPFPVPAGGPDIFRTFVLPVPISEPVFVRAMELRSDNPAVLHHANVYLDRNRSTRHLDELDPGPGFSGMNAGDSTSPEGQFLAWTPGKRRIGSSLSSWKLEPGTDLIVQAHIQPTGKASRLRPQLALYFTKDPPAPNLDLLRMNSRAIDIPAGAKDHVVDLEYRFPVDVDVLSVFPHAHFLARKIEGYAELPSGEKKWLFKIDDWNFDWQDEYTFVDPVPLPKGSRVRVHFVYDNSPDNPRNPSNPPVRVFAGEESKDEMANFMMQVRANNTADNRLLQAHSTRSFLDGDIRDLEQLTAKDPDPELGIILGQEYEKLGRIDDAIRTYKRVIEWKPDFALAFNNLGVASLARGRLEEGLAALTKAHELIGCKHGPGAQAMLGAAEIHNNLGNALGALGRGDEALVNYEQAIALWPEYADAQYNAANVYAAKGELDRAIALFRKALKAKPDAADIHTNLGIALMSKDGTAAEAIVHFERSAELAPSQQTHHNLERARSRLESLRGKVQK